VLGWFVIINGNYVGITHHKTLILMIGYIRTSATFMLNIVIICIIISMIYKDSLILYASEKSAAIKALLLNQKSRFINS